MIHSYIIQGMRDDPLHFDLLTVIIVRMSPRDAQLYFPPAQIALTVAEETNWEVLACLAVQGELLTRRYTYLPTQ